MDSNQLAKLLRNVDKPKSVGTLIRIKGPMFGGKTTALISKLVRVADIGFKALYINHSDDVRTTESSSENVTTHNSGFKGLSKKVKSISVDSLKKINVDFYDYIGIDEAHFFPDIEQVVRDWKLRKGKNVIIAYLNGDFQMKVFGNGGCQKLESIADKNIDLTASCKVCFTMERKQVEAKYSYRLTDNMEQKSVGGEDQYIPVCAICRVWLMRSKNVFTLGNFHMSEGDYLKFMKTVPVDYTKFKTSPVSWYSSTMPLQAKQIFDFLKQHLDINKKMKIVDGTSHIGVDSVLFSKFFPKSNILSIELDEKIFSLLKGNVTRFSLTERIKCLNKNFLTWMLNLSPEYNFDLIYVDPPWGGPEYKRQKEMELFLLDESNKKWSMNKIISHLLTKGMAKYVLIRFPMNHKVYKSYDFDGNIKSKCKPIKHIHKDGNCFVEHLFYKEQS